MADDREVRELRDRVDSLEALLRRYLLLGEVGSSGNSITQEGLVGGLGLSERFYKKFVGGPSIPTAPTIYSCDFSIGGAPLLDTIGAYDPLNPSYLTIPKAGLYIIRYGLQTAATMSTGKYFCLRLRSHYPGYASIASFKYVPALTGSPSADVFVDCKDLEAGHKLYFEVFHNQGVNVAVDYGIVSLFRIGEKSLPPDIMIP